MPKIIRIDNVDDKKSLESTLVKALQSGNLNFIIGSGASMPAIKVAGAIENAIQKHFSDGKEAEAYKLIYTFLSDLQEPNTALIADGKLTIKTGESDGEHKTRQSYLDSVLGEYQNFIKTIEKILNQRKTNILPKQTNIFTTNYDVFFERASESFPAIKFNDGFTRTANLKQIHFFSSQNFSNSLYNNGNLYSYKVEIPSINLIKLHGSLTWQKNEDEISYKSNTVEAPDNIDDLTQLKSYAQEFAVILPQKGKFRETILDRTYYDLLRFYANELDKENTLLITFGFSFSDEHIYDITKRALKNPTLKLMIVAFDNKNIDDFNAKFDGYNNVEIIAPEDTNNIDFNKFNALLNCIPSDSERTA